MACKLNEQYIMDILQEIDGNMSELSDLDDGDEDEDYIQPQSQTAFEDQVPVLEDNESEELLDSIFPRLSWKEGIFNPNISPFVEVPRDIPDHLLTPLEYFRKLVTDETLDMIVEETNIYSTQKTGINVNTNRPEIEKILGIYLRMGLCQMPSICCYWETNLAYSLVSEVMPRNRFEKLMTCLHFKNNLTVSDAEKEDKLWKIRPCLEKLRNCFLLEAAEENHSVDEMMIAFKGRSHLRQFIQNKPTRWGFKVWGRAGASGYLYDFDVYQGAAGNKGKKRELGKGVGFEEVMNLTNSLPEGHYFKVFADNFFTTDILVQALLERNIYFLGTIRVNRLKDCPLPLEKEMKKQGRGSVASLVDTTSRFSVVRWYDNKPVTLLSSFVGAEPEDEVRRWDKANKQHIQVKRPSVVKEYNRFMGGLDLHDMLSSLYKYHFKSRRWYTYIFWHLITVAVTNSWIRYRKDCEVLHERHLPLRKFQADLASALILAGKGKSKRGHPSADDMPPQRRRAASTVVPVFDCQKDKYEHWPVWKEARGRCKICIKLNSFAWCEKCEVYLCFNKDRNCFRRFHV